MSNRRNQNSPTQGLPSHITQRKNTIETIENRIHRLVVLALHRAWKSSLNPPLGWVFAVLSVVFTAIKSLF